MPYVPPGPSSSTQACIPRRSVVKTVMDQTREKNGSKAKAGPAMEEKQSTSTLPPGIDTTAATSALAEQLEVTHIGQPAINANVNLAAPHASDNDSSTSIPSDASNSSVSRTDSDSDLEAKRRLSAGQDAMSSYKAALYLYTRNLLKDAEDTTQKASEKTSAFPQFGAKQSGMQRMAAKKALARQLNA